MKKIRVYPDPILAKTAAHVVHFDEALYRLVQDMLQIRRNANGLGLAAPQIGVSKRVFVVDLKACGLDEDIDRQVLIAVNPLVIRTVGTKQAAAEESCLSLPGQSVVVRRDVRVELAARDVHGKAFLWSAEHLLAAVIQHEADHLDGKLILDRAVRRA